LLSRPINFADGREARQAFRRALQSLPHHEEALANVQEAIDLYVADILEKLGKTIPLLASGFL
jgi:hypothetical protein